MSRRKLGRPLVAAKVACWRQDPDPTQRQIGRNLPRCDVSVQIMLGRHLRLTPSSPSPRQRATKHAGRTLAVNMVLSMKIQYRAEKARLFNAYQEDSSKYLAGFLGEDLQRFKLPLPDDCGLRAWRTAWVMCRWYTKEGEVCLPLTCGAMNDHCLHGVVAAI